MAGGPTVGVTGNIYASNALSTTNIFASGNVSATQFITVGAATPGTTGTGTPLTYAVDIITTPASGAASPFIRLGNATGGGGAQVGIDLNPTNASHTGGPAVRISAIDATSGQAHLLFLTSAAGTGQPTERMRITNTGFVGIGTTTPNASLQITGNAFISNAVTTTNLFANTLTMSNAFSVLTVTGNAFISNAVTTTNLFANTLTMSNAFSFLSVTGNAFISNAVTTTNLFSTNVVATSTLRIGAGTIGSNVAIFSNVAGGQNAVVINSNAWVGIGTTNPTSSLVVNGNAAFSTDTFVVPFATVGTLGVLSGATIGPSSTVLGSNLMVLSNASGGSNVTIFTGNTVGISNLAPATTLSVGGTISAIGNVVTSNYGTCPPLTFRQGALGTNWITAGTNNVPLGTGSVNMQCGTGVTATNTLTVTYPLSYAGQPIVLLTAIGAGNSNIWVSTAPTTTNFVVTSNTAAQTFSWMSIGI